MAELIGKPKEQKVGKKKHEDIAIVQFMEFGLPTQVGSINLVIHGLGNDDVMYQYEPKTKAWYAL